MYSIISLDIVLIGNFFGSIFSELMSVGWSSEYGFGLWVTGASLFVYIIPLISIPLIFFSVIIVYLFPESKIPYLSNNYRTWSIFIAIIGFVFLLEGFFFGSFAWPWNLFELVFN